MLTGFAKRVFHAYLIYQLWQFITSDWWKKLTWNLVSGMHYSGVSRLFLLVGHSWGTEYDAP